jgi:hypothetical protein
VVICFNCREETKRILDVLVDRGSYSDYAEVIAVAIANLHVLHEEVGNRGALVVGGDPSPVPAVSSPRAQAAVRSVQNGVSATGDHMPPSHGRTRLSLPRLFSLLPVEACPPLLEVADEVPSGDVSTPLEQWVFGQYNRLLPAKATCRALAHLTQEHRQGVPLADAAHLIAEEAAKLGDELARRDEATGAKRGSALATAFPRTGPKAEKGRLRYADQFVATRDRSARLSGLPFDYRLIGGADPANEALLLTQAGWHLAAMPNPVLDDGQADPDPRFSDDEVAFMLRHIASSVPVEDFAFRIIIAAIQAGHDTPDSLDAALRQYVSPAAGDRVSPSFLSSQRSGAISRMADLGLVRRTPDGVRVSYAVTPAGEGFIQHSAR